MIMAIAFPQNASAMSGGFSKIARLALKTNGK